jgi:hypothetical protein
MPGAFESVAISWRGVEKVILPDQLLRCIAKIEDVLTLAELERYAEERKVPFGKIAMAFGAVLRHAGFKVTDLEVYRELFNETEGTEDEKKYAVAIDAVQKLLVLMLPPDYIQKKLEDQQTKK